MDLEPSDLWGLWVLLQHYVLVLRLVLPSMSLLDYWDTKRPLAKRRKITEDSQPVAAGEEKDSPDESDCPLIEADTPLPDRRDGYSTLTAIGEEAGNDAEIPSNSQTELESSLPAVQADNRAIEEYELSRAVDDEPGLQQRLRDGTWRKGRSSIYVDAFNLALETVLDEEAHLFDEAEMEVFRQWRELDYEAQYLYVLQSFMYARARLTDQICASLPPQNLGLAPHQSTRILFRYCRYAPGSRRIAPRSQASIVYGWKLHGHRRRPC